MSDARPVGRPGIEPGTRGLKDAPDLVRDCAWECIAAGQRPDRFHEGAHASTDVRSGGCQLGCQSGGSWPGLDSDPRFTARLVADVAAVLVQHGYPPRDEAGLVRLLRVLFVALRDEPGKAEPGSPD